MALEFNASPMQIIEQLDIHPRYKSAKRLNRWIAEAEGHQEFLEEFAQKLDRSEEVKAALSATSELKAEEEEAFLWVCAEANMHRFKPYIEIMTNQRGPKQIFVEVFSGGKFKRVPWEADPQESITAARIRAARTCVNHYNALDEDRKVTNWGRVEYYYFVESWRRYLRISVDGEIEEIIEQPRPPAGATLSIGGKELSPGLALELLGVENLERIKGKD
jgi:hypothetical protein